MKNPWLVLSGAAALAVPLGWAAPSSAQQAPAAVPAPALSAPATRPADDVEEIPLGQAYESQSSGIIFRPPADCELVNSISSKYIAEWADSKRDWTLKLGKMVLDRQTPLRDTTDNFGKPVEGVLERTVKNLQASLPGSKILRQDVTNTREGGHFDARHPESRDNVGLIAIRYTTGGMRRLSQQAIIAAGGVDYLLTLTSPGNKDDADNAPDDPGEKLAVETFSRMIDSIRLLDRSAIKADQDERLLHSRWALTYWTPSKMQGALINEQWVRILRNGKDVGYSYITEDRAGGIPRPLTRDELNGGKVTEIQLAQAKKGDGILIGVRARMIADGVRSDKTRGPIQSDSSSWFFVSIDKKHEDFSRVIVTDDHKAVKKGYLQEFGVSDKRVRRVVERAEESPQEQQSAIKLNTRPDALNVSYKEDWELDVSQSGPGGMAPPVSRKLPPFYIPQAITHLLPRLLPLDRPQGYLFATYVSDAREVIMRYIDVLPEQQVSFSGQWMRAIPVRDRMGLQGSITTHYLTIDGRYLGSENKEQNLLMLPTDDKMLQHIWQDANLTRPGGVERPNPGSITTGGTGTGTGDFNPPDPIGPYIRQAPTRAQ